MSYEQKYLKYKQKYQELKKLLGNHVTELETEKVSEMPDFNLSDTPTGTIEAPKMLGGAEAESEVMDFDLTETPTGSIIGGAALIAAPYTPSAPLSTCAGQVNPMPNVNVPMHGGSPLVASPYTPSAPLSTCAGQVNPMPNVNVPMTMQNKNLIHNTEEHMSELSEIQNTEDIARLFGQYGGKRHDSESSHSSQSSSTTSSTDSDISTTDSF
jgi:hypothetical protein